MKPKQFMHPALPSTSLQKRHTESQTS